MRYIIKTSGLMCGHCDASVETELLKVPGVHEADADHESQTVEVEADAEGLEEALAAAVAAAGDKFRALFVETA